MTFLIALFSAIGLLGAAGCSLSDADSPVVVIVNGKPITQTEVDYRWSKLPDSLRTHYASQGGKRRFLDELVTRELLLQEARREGLEHRPDVMERLERSREDVLLHEVMQELVGGHPFRVADEELQAYIDAHPESTLEAQQVRLAQIMVGSEQQAKDIKRQLEQGYDFGRLAQKYSLDEATRAKGGEVGLYRKGVVAPEVEPVLLTLRPGAVSEPVPARNGYYLVKVLGREPGDSANSQAARQRLKQELYAEKRRKQFEDAMAKLRSSATIRMADLSALAVDSAAVPANKP
jgi:peptidyl-prolyl cis-trans isomerase C